jgi:hypothetical protein
MKGAGERVSGAGVSRVIIGARQVPDIAARCMTNDRQDELVAKLR